jgi:hypothetical protein
MLERSGCASPRGGYGESRLQPISMPITENSFAKPRYSAHRHHMPDIIARPSAVIGD